MPSVNNIIALLNILKKGGITVRVVKLDNALSGGHEVAVREHQLDVFLPEGQFEVVFDRLSLNLNDFHVPYALFVKFSTQLKTETLYVPESQQGLLLVRRQEGDLVVVVVEHVLLT